VLICHVPVDARPDDKAVGDADAAGVGEERVRLAGLVRRPEKK
jgi:hypothetical protein